MNNIRTQAQSITAKQRLGIFFIALSLFTYFGGLNFVFTASTIGCSVHLTVRDVDTYQPVEGVSVNLDGVHLFPSREYVPVDMEIGPTDSNGECSVSANMSGTFYLTFSKTGYETESAQLIGRGDSVDGTFCLTPAPEDPEPTEPETPEEPTEPEEPTVIPGTQMNTWRNMLSGVFAVIGLGFIVLDIGERRK